MARSPDSGKIDLAEVFRHVQKEMLAQLAVGRLFEHASASGTASEHHWIELFDRYLPKSYRAAPAFVINAAGRRSRQIDLAVFDNLSSLSCSRTPPASTSPSRACTQCSKSSPHFRASGSATPPKKPPASEPSNPPEPAAPS
jgi:hypothetical protein